LASVTVDNFCRERIFSRDNRQKRSNVCYVLFIRFINMICRMLQIN
jgi:hypothetical protein